LTAFEPHGPAVAGSPDPVAGVGFPHPSVAAGASGFLEESLFPIFNRGEYDQYVSKGEVAYMQDKSTLAKAYIRTHPAEFLRVSAVRFVRFWIGTGNKDGSVIFMLHAVLTTSFGLMGIWRLFERGRISLAVLFLLPLMLFPLPYYITHAEFRYRLIIDPLPRDILPP